MNKYLLLITPIIFLSGCMSFTEQAKDRCVSYGYASGSPEMVQCVATESKECRKAFTEWTNSMRYQPSGTFTTPKTIRTNRTIWGNIISCTI